MTTKSKVIHHPVSWNQQGIVLINWESQHLAKHYMIIAGIKSWDRPPSNDDDYIMIILSSYVLLANLLLMMMARLLLLLLLTKPTVLASCSSTFIETNLHSLLPGCWLKRVNCFAVGFFLCFDSYLSYLLVLICWSESFPVSICISPLPWSLTSVNVFSTRAISPNPSM